jgi:hypothetical protein
MEKMTIDKAKNDISQILKRLEVDNDVVVEGISCEAIDVTQIGDNGQVLKMMINIEIQRKPGILW